MHLKFAGLFQIILHIIAHVIDNLLRAYTYLYMQYLSISIYFTFLKLRHRKTTRTIRTQKNKVMQKQVQEGSRSNFPIRVFICFICKLTNFKQTSIVSVQNMFFLVKIASLHFALSAGKGGLEIGNSLSKKV